jgi:putative addiction module component (TIGR02574 family)
MQHTFEEASQIAHSLPEDQRIQLANALYESVAHEEPEGTEAEITAAWEDEIKRRLDEIDSGAVQMIPGEEVMAKMLSKLSPEARARLDK